MQIEQVRKNMIEQQIRPWGVLDHSVLDLLAEVHREDFIPPELRALAFADTPVPIGCGQFALTPKIEARLLQSLTLRPNDQVLEIGTGCAYLTALLARSSAFVTSIDIHPEFTATATEKMARHAITNIDLRTADAFADQGSLQSYDVIAVTGSIPVLNDFLYPHLNDHGRMFIVAGQSPIMEALLIRAIDGSHAIESLFETHLPPLIGADPGRRFEF